MEGMEVDQNTSTEVWKQFNLRLNGIRDSMALVSDKDTEKGLEAVSRLKISASDLQKYITASVGVMPAYDVRRTQECFNMKMIDKLNVDLKALELSMKPKKKFAFSSRTKADLSKPEKEEQTKVVEKSSVVESSEIEASNTRVLRDITGETILLTRSDFPLKSDVRHQLLIKNCTNTVVAAMSVLGTVRIEHSTGCSIYLGPCCTSAYLESCKDCIVFAASHQLRIHECHGCNLYVRVNSHPIIEDCSSMGFARYNIAYPGISEDFAAASLTEASHWSNVVDFRWHKKTQSPNWHIISENSIIATLPVEMATQGWGFDMDHNTSAVLDEI